LNKRYNYTLIELIAVIIIAGMLSTIVVSQFRKLPAFISLESKVSELKKVLALARNNAACSGVNTRIVFDAENRRIFMPGKSSNPIEMLLPKEVKILINDEEVEEVSEEEEIILFKFYPDGSGDGSSVSLELKKHKFKISISPLSGSVSAEEINEQK
jgi:Tfp pilus assembly protein FimT